jgi:hypothetical protein
MEQKSGPKKDSPSEFDRFLNFFIEFGFDFLTGIAVFAAFLLFAWVLELARATGWGNPEYFKAYDNGHFYLNVALFVTVCLALFLRVLRALWKQQSSPMEVLKRSWARFSTFFRSFSTDTLIGLTIFAASLLFARSVMLFRAYGWGSEEHFKTYEFVHFWITYACFFAVGIAFLLRMWKALWAELT